MLLEYLVPSRARRDVWKALSASEEGLTIRRVAIESGVPYSNVHREVLRMRELELVRTRKVGNALLCTWNRGNPAAQKLTALLNVAGYRPPGEPADDFIIRNLRHWGAGLVGKGSPKRPLDLEETLARGIELARREATVLQVLPVVLALHRDRVDLRLLELQARRLGQKRALGFLLSVTGLFLGDASLKAYARRLRDTRVRKPQNFFTRFHSKRLTAITRERTPKLALEWKFWMNTSIESLRSHYDKFIGLGWNP